MSPETSVYRRVVRLAFDLGRPERQVSFSWGSASSSISSCLRSRRATACSGAREGLEEQGDGGDGVGGGCLPFLVGVVLAELVGVGERSLAAHVGHVGGQVVEGGAQGREVAG